MKLRFENGNGNQLIQSLASQVDLSKVEGLELRFPATVEAPETGEASGFRLTFIARDEDVVLYEVEKIDGDHSEWEVSLEEVENFRN